MLGSWGTVLRAAPSCGPYPNCLYVTPVNVSFLVSTSQVTYQDAASLPRTISFAIRTPNGLAGPLPVVIWSHGGAEGHLDPLTALSEWGELTARAGYISVGIAHAPRPTFAVSSLCNALGIPDCTTFKYLNWDRPHDISKVIDRLAAINAAAGPLQGRINMNKIAVGGHSAGSGGTLSVAGAVRFFANTPKALADPRPVAFLAFSPQGPGSEGFFETDFQFPHTSWDNISRPVLAGTGDGDNTCNPAAECSGTSPSVRRISYDQMPTGGKYLMHIHDTDTFHGLFGFNIAECVSRGVAPGKCNAFRQWLASSALAFLDAHVRGSVAAKGWLLGGYIEQASAGGRCCRMEIEVGHKREGG
jgi:acetyl esterase/lipase